MMEYIEEENEWMEIKVSDTGIGIPDADKQHIFERFYQAAHKGMEETTGNGIGLSLVHDFVQLHGGSVEVFDNIGAGTVFVVRLPVRHVDVAAVLPEPLVVLPESEKTTEGRNFHFYWLSMIMLISVCSCSTVWNCSIG